MSIDSKIDSLTCLCSRPKYSIYTGQFIVKLNTTITITACIKTFINTGLPRSLPIPRWPNPAMPIMYCQTLTSLQ